MPSKKLGSQRKGTQVSNRSCSRALCFRRMCQVKPALHAPRQSDGRCRLSVDPPFRNSTRLLSFVWHSTGRTGGDATFIGHRAYENCKLLTQVDFSSTGIAVLHMHTFSHCHSLRNVSLPPSLREIRAEDFVGCKALHSLAIPGKLRYIGHRAFGQCTAFSCLIYSRCKRGAWRRPYVAYNAFEECYKLVIPWWLHYLPSNGSDWMVPPSHHT